MWRYWSVPAVLAFGSSLLYWQAPTFSRPVPAVQHLHEVRAAQVSLALDRVVDWDFTEMPLHELPAQLEKELKLPVVIDVRSLEDASIGTDTLLTCKLRNMSARAALRFLLGRHGIACFLRDECLVIATQEEMETTLQTRLYPVVDLVQVYDEKGRDTDYDSLIELITSTISPNTWLERGGGSGTICPCEAAGALVIAQTDVEHERIELLLQRLRSLRDKQGIHGPVYRRRPDYRGGFGGAVQGTALPAGGSGAISNGAGGGFGGAGFF